MRKPPSLHSSLINFIAVEINCGVLLMGGDEWTTFFGVYACALVCIFDPYFRIKTLRQNTLEDLAE